MDFIPGCVKPKTIKLVFAASLLNMKHDELKVKNGWLRVRVMCMRGTQTIV